MTRQPGWICFNRSCSSGGDTTNHAKRIRIKLINHRNIRNTNQMNLQNIFVKAETGSCGLKNWKNGLKKKSFRQSTTDRPADGGVSNDWTLCPIETAGYGQNPPVNRQVPVASPWLSFGNRQLPASKRWLPVENLWLTFGNRQLPASSLWLPASKP
jgi:hypothetical protein